MPASQTANYGNDNEDHLKTYRICYDDLSILALRDKCSRQWPQKAAALNHQQK